METQRPLVSILCMAYNHGAYIRQCLNGFIIQKTNFEFEAIVHDDASTDETAKIIQEYSNKYPNIIKPIFETENQYSKQDDAIIKNMIKAIHPQSKYIALCEGDDFWTDPLKLQKQIDLLETDKHCSIVYSRVKCYDQLKHKVVAIFGKPRRDLKDRLENECFIATCTSCFRKKDYLDFLREINPHTHNWLMGDIPLFLYLGTKGTGRMLKECTSVYRILGTSASHSNNIELQLERIQNTIDIYKFFADKYYPCNKSVRNKLYGGYLYRVYQLYKKNNLPLPEKYKSLILSYRGGYLKIHVIKITLKSEFFRKIIDFLINCRMTFIIWIFHK